MPYVSMFFGIIIRMFYSEHNPPHFHAKYGDYEIVIQIETGIVEGKFPKRALNHVLEWFELHKDELLQNWYSIIEFGHFNKINPLE